MTVAKAYKDLAEAGFVEGRARGRHARACAERSRFQARGGGRCQAVLGGEGPDAAA